MFGILRPSVCLLCYVLCVSSFASLLARLTAFRFPQTRVSPEAGELVLTRWDMVRRRPCLELAAEEALP